MTDLATLIAEIEKEFPNQLWLVRSEENKRFFAHICPFDSIGNGGAYASTPEQALRGARMKARLAKETQETTS